MQDIWTLHFDTHNHVATVDSIIRLCKAHYYFALVEQMFEKSRDPRQARSCWALFIKLQMSLDQINISYNDSPSR